MKLVLQYLLLCRFQNLVIFIVLSTIVEGNPKCKRGYDNISSNCLSVHSNHYPQSGATHLRSENNDHNYNNINNININIKNRIVNHLSSFNNTGRNIKI